MVSWIILLLLIVLTVVNPWWLIAVVVLMCLIVGQWYSYKSLPWRCTHYPMLRKYSAIAGQEATVAEHSGNFDIRYALVRLVQTIKQSWSGEKVYALIQRELDRCGKINDRRFVEACLRKKNTKMTDIKIEEVIERASKFFKTDDNGMMVRLIVAGIIENEFSQEHRAEYLVALMSGKAV